jgi:hypothetical protein
VIVCPHRAARAGMELKYTRPYRVIEKLHGLYIAGKGLLCLQTDCASG